MAAEHSKSKWHTMGHDDAAYESRAGSPAALLWVHQVPGLIQKLRSKGLCKIVTQIMTGARLRPMHNPSAALLQNRDHDRPQHCCPSAMSCIQSKISIPAGTEKVCHSRPTPLTFSFQSWHTQALKSMIELEAVPDTTAGGHLP